MLLKAAMPMLATVSAEAQGKALVAVCTVYGMSMVSVDGGDPSAGSALPQQPKPDDTTAHLDHHCALTALGALATADDPPIAPTRAVRPYRGRASPSAAIFAGHDAAAAWVAGRKQGPPLIS